MPPCAHLSAYNWDAFTHEKSHAAEQKGGGEIKQGSKLGVEDTERDDSKPFVEYLRWLKNQDTRLEPLFKS